MSDSVWSDIKSIFRSLFSVSKDVAVITAEGLSVTAKAANELSQSINEATSQWLIDMAEDWCNEQDSACIRSLRGNNAKLAHDYFKEVFTNIESDYSDAGEFPTYVKSILGEEVFVDLRRISLEKRNKLIEAREFSMAIKNR